MAIHLGKNRVEKKKIELPQYHMKMLLNSFLFNGYTLGFYSQT